jgi:actin-related protein
MHDAASLLTFLNLQERGADTLILQLGSHSIKFGLASQSTPFIAPNVIAHPRKDGRKLFELNDKIRELENVKQQIFDNLVDRALPDIEH